MKTTTSFFRTSGLIASLLLWMGGPESQAQSDLVHIPDPELQSVIRDTLNKPTGDLTVADMESLTALDASTQTRGAARPAITSLEGLQTARNLRVLNFEGGIWWRGTPDPTVLATTNLAPLGALPNLEWLNLSYYYRSAPPSPTLPSVLSSLTNLRSLILYETPLANSSFVTNLMRLQRLEIDGAVGTVGTEMPPLAGLGELEVLRLSHIYIDEVTIPSSLTRLRELCLFQMGISNLVFAQQLPALQSLELSNNEFISLSFLTALPGLRRCDLSFNNLKQVHWPETPAQLEYLSVFGNPLTNLSLPAAVDLSALILEGFPKNQVTLRGLWMHPPRLRPNGTISLRIRGARGGAAQVQRSTNLADWEPWRTAVLGQLGEVDVTDDASSTAVQFYRVRMPAE